MFPDADRGPCAGPMFGAAGARFRPAAQLGFGATDGQPEHLNRSRRRVVGVQALAQHIDAAAVQAHNRAVASGGDVMNDVRPQRRVVSQPLHLVKPQGRQHGGMLLAREVMEPEGAVVMATLQLLSALIFAGLVSVSVPPPALVNV